MALIDDFLKWIWIWNKTDNVPLPTASEVPNFVNPYAWSNVTPYMPEPSVFTPSVQAVKPVPTVTNNAYTWSNTSTGYQNTIDPVKESILNQYNPQSTFVNPFAWSNITPYQPMTDLSIPWTNTWLSFDLYKPFSIPSYQNDQNAWFTQQENDAVNFKQNQPALEKATEDYLSEINSWPLQWLNNTLFWVSYSDLSNVMKQAKETIDKTPSPVIPSQWAGTVLPAVYWTSLLDNATIFDWSNAEVRKQKDLANKFLEDMKKIAPWQVASALWEDKMHYDNISNRINSKLSTTIWNALNFNDPLLWVATENAADLWTRIRDFSEEMSAYAVWMDHSYKNAIVNWDVLRADSIRKQIDTNINNLSDKRAEHANWITNYKNANPEASDRNAENEYAKYIQSLWYRSINAYRIDWLVQDNWKQIDKEQSNILSRFWTSIDLLNLNSHVNEWSLIWDSNTVWSFVMAPTSRLFNYVLSNKLWADAYNATLDKINPLAKVIDSVVWWNIAQNFISNSKLKWNQWQLISQLAQADYSEAIWWEWSNTKKTFMDWAYYFTQVIWDKLPEAAATTFFIAATEWAWSASYLWKIWYIDDLASVSTAISRAKNMSTRSLEFLARRWMVETAQNISIDYNDQNASSRWNMIMNMRWSFLGVWTEVRWFLRETSLLDDKLVRWVLNNRIASQRADKEASRTWISFKDALDKFYTLPVNERWTITASEEWLAAISNSQRWIKKQRDDVIASINNLRKNAKTPEEAAVYEQQLAKMYESEKAWVIEQSLLWRLLSQNWLSEQDAVVFKRLVKDMSNPNVLTQDIVRVLRQNLWKESQWVIEWTLEDIARKSRSWWSFRSWDYIYRDSWVQSLYIAKTIWIEPWKVYKLWQLNEATIKWANISRLEWTKIWSEIMEKEWNKFKYFTETAWWYELNLDGLNKLNVWIANWSQEVRQAIIKEVETWWDNMQSMFTTTVKSKIQDLQSAWLSIDAKDIDNIEKYNTYDVLRNSVDEYIPCP